MQLLLFPLCVECYATVDSSDSISTTSSDTKATPSAVTKAEQGDNITTIGKSYHRAENLRM